MDLEKEKAKEEEMDDGAINLSQATTMELATRFGSRLERLPSCRSQEKGDRKQSLKLEVTARPCR